MGDCTDALRQMPSDRLLSGMSFGKFSSACKCVA